jgi:hypothetical protein
MQTSALCPTSLIRSVLYNFVAEKGIRDLTRQLDGGIEL